MKAILARVLQLRIVRAYLRYSELHGPALADSITYRALFSVFAALLLGFSVAALWLDVNPDAMRALSDALDSMIPGIIDFVNPESIEAPTSFTIVGIISLLGLIGAAISAITSLRTALHVLADELHDGGFFLWVLLRDLLVAIGFGGLLGLAAGLSMLSSVGVEAIDTWLGLNSSIAMDITTRIVGILIVFVIDTVAVALVFSLLSGVKAPFRALWGGALLAGLGLTVLQELSGLFVQGATSNPLLASFAALIALLLWFNLSAQVILIASTYIIVATAESQDRVREKFGASTLTQLRRRRAEDHLHAASQNLREAQDAERKEAEKNTAAQNRARAGTH